MAERMDYRFRTKPNRQSARPVTLKVNHLSQSCTESTLKRQFSKFGHIISLKIIPVPSSNENYAYVNYNSLESAQEAEKQMNGYVCLPNQTTPLGVTIKTSHTLKLNNVPGSVNESDLLCLCREFNVASVKVNVNAKGNFAYANFLDRLSAQQAKEHLETNWSHCHGFSVNLHQPSSSQHQLLATNSPMREFEEPMSSQQGTASSFPYELAMPIEEKSSQSIKVVINGQGITPEDLTGIFSHYGSLTDKPRIISGSPDYAYINYTDSTSASAASKQCQIYFKNIKLTVKLQKSSRPFAVKKSKIEIRNEDLIVNHLLTTHPVYSAEVKEYIQRHDMILNAISEETLQVFGNESDLPLARIFFQALVDRIKHSLSKEQANFHSHYFPHLANVKLIEDVEKKFHVEFSIGDKDGLFVKMAEISKKVASLTKPASDATSCECNSYITTKDSHISSTAVTWYFEDNDHIWIKFDSSCAQAVEELFQKNKSGPLSRDSWSYKYNFSTMQQTNIQTSRVRKIKREKSSGIINTELHAHYFTIQCRGESTKLSAAIEDLQKSFSQECVTLKLILDMATTSEHISTLLCFGSQYLVKLSVDRSVVPLKMNITGYPGYADKVKLILKEKALDMIAQIIKSSAATPLSSEYPYEWDPQRKTLELITLSKMTNAVEWRRVVSKFQATMANSSVISIQRIQNKWLWKKYTHHKKMIEEKGNGTANEKELFHGTGDNEPRDIYDSEEGFDMRFSADGMWGQANYFAVNASYSDQYAYQKGTNRQLFLVKVLTGDSYSSSPDSLRMPPLKQQSIFQSLLRAKGEVQQLSQVRYDSVTGTTRGSQVYMTYDNLKAYPAYLITYN